MNRRNNTTARLSRLAPLAFLLLALQAPGVPVLARQCAAPGGPCTITVIGSNFGGSYLDVEKSPACKAAIPALKAAAIMVIGEPQDADIATWLSAVANTPAWRAKFDDGLKFIDAVNFLKERIAAAGAADRAKAIDNAFMEVIGRPSSPEEQAVYETKVKAQQAWYATIVGELRGRLKGNVPDKRVAITLAYRAAFGREPTPEESQYWRARDDHYRQMREHARNWLYSTEGAKDLVETVSRALKSKSGQQPSDDAVKKAMAQFTGKRLIYEEMVKQL